MQVKTIMAGLLVRELKLRGLIERVLVVCPANLSFQWQREHASGSETFCGRVVGALKAEALLYESVGAGYIDRYWPSAIEDAGAWPLTSLRQSFLNSSLTRLINPDAVLRRKIVEFVESLAAEASHYRS